MQDKQPKRRARLSLPGLRMRVSERRVLLTVMDLALINAALCGALWIGTHYLGAVMVPPQTKWFVTLAVVWMATASFFDCYDLARSASTFYSVRSSAAAVVSAVLIYILIPILTPPLQSRGLIFIFGGAALLLIVAWRVFYAQVFVQPWFKQRALVVGAGHAGQTLAEALAQHPDDANPFRGTGYLLVGFVDDNPAYQGTEIAGVPVLGRREQLIELAQRYQVDEIVLAITHRHAIAEELFDALLRCRELGFRLTTMSSLYERLLGRVPVEHIGRDLHMVVPMEEPSVDRLYHIAKRGFDLLIAIMGLAAMGLLIPVLALVNAFTSPGPLFYWQERVGYGGRAFRILKFRSMIPNAEGNTGAVWAASNDCRVTPIGRLLRSVRLDEVPQCWNILRGEMSLIGPRPERPEFVEALVHSVPFYRARHAVRPGLTGWAQVQYDYGDSVDDARVKLEYDLYYVKHMGFWLDFRILMQTIPVMLQRRGH